MDTCSQVAQQCHLRCGAAAINAAVDKHFSGGRCTTVHACCSSGTRFTFVQVAISMQQKVWGQQHIADEAA